MRTSAANEEVQLAHGSRHAASRRVDGVRPTVRSAEAQGPTVTVTWSEPLDEDSVPAGAGRMRVRIGNANGPAVTAVSVVESTTVLTLASAIADGTQNVTLEYDESRASPPVRDAAGNAAASISRTQAEPVQVGEDARAPELAGAPTVDGATLKLTFDERLDADSIPSAPGGFTVTVTRDGATVPDVTITALALDSAGTALTLTLSEGVRRGDSVVLRYTPPSTSPLRDRATTPNAVAAFTTGTGDAPGVDDRTAALEVALSQSSATEGEDRTVTLTVAAQGDATVGADRVIALTVSGTAQEGADWAVDSTTETLAAGAQIVEFPVTVINDARLEDEESVTFSLTADGAAIGSATLTIADNDRAVLNVVAPEGGATEGGVPFTLALRLDPHPENSASLGADECFLDFAVTAQLTNSGDVDELSDTPALPQEVSFPATSFEDCTREVTLEFETRASDGEWEAPRAVTFSLWLQTGQGYDSRIEAGNAEVKITEDTPPPGPLTTEVRIEPVLPEATDDYTASRTRKAFKKVALESLHGPGATLTFTVSFDQAVTVEANEDNGALPELVLDVSGRERRATLGGSRTDTQSLTFRWTVARGDYDPDGIAIRRIDPRGARIRFAAGCQIVEGVTLPYDFDVDTFVREHGGARRAHRVRGGFFTMGLDTGATERSAREGEHFRVWIRRFGGAHDEYTLATVWIVDSAAEGGRLVGVPIQAEGQRRLDGVQSDGRSGYVDVPVAGNGETHAERAWTVHLSGTDSNDGGRPSWYDPSGPEEVVVTIDDAEIGDNPPLLSVGPADIHEPETGTAPITFRVCLWTEKGCPTRSGQEPGFDAYKGVAHEVRVDWSTADETAVAGQDYRADSGTLVFAPGETVQTVEIDVMADAHDEEMEAFWLELSNPVGAQLSRQWRNWAQIHNDGPIPKAWIGRFGRTVAEQVIDALETRMQGAHPPGAQIVIGGAQAHIGAEPVAEGESDSVDETHTTQAQREGESITAWHDQWGGPESEALGARDVLLGSSFALPAKTRGSDVAALWGRLAVSGFNGREGDIDATLGGLYPWACATRRWRRSIPGASPRRYAPRSRVLPRGSFSKEPRTCACSAIRVRVRLTWSRRSATSWCAKVIQCSSPRSRPWSNVSSKPNATFA